MMVFEVGLNARCDVRWLGAHGSHRLESECGMPHGSMCSNSLQLVTLSWEVEQPLGAEASLDDVGCWGGAERCFMGYSPDFDLTILFFPMCLQINKQLDFLAATVTGHSPHNASLPWYAAPGTQTESPNKPFLPLAALHRAFCHSEK